MKNTINKFLKKLGVEVHGVNYLKAMAKGDFKKNAFEEQKLWFEDCHSSVKIIFDVGANRGDTVKLYRSLFPSSKIYAFEPFIDSFNVLQERFKGDENIICINEALTNSIGEKILFVNESVDTNSLFQSQTTGLNSDLAVKNKSTIQVRATTLESFCLQNGIIKIDILKMDVQGSELNILKGGKQLLLNNLIELIYAETYFIQQYENQPLFYDIAIYLKDFGYNLQDIYSPIYGNRKIAWSDCIFVKH